MKNNKFSLIILIIFIVALFNPFSLKFFVNSLYFVSNNEEILADENDYIEITSTGDLISDSEEKKYKSTDITGEEYSFDTKYYPYYGMLSDNEKKFYKQVYAHMDKIIQTFKPYVDVNVSEVKKVFEAIYNDHPELFWVNTVYSYKYTATNKCVQIELEFNNTINDIEKSKRIFNSEIDKIIKGARKYKTNYEREKYVHDVIVSTIKYEKDAPMNQSAYSALINKKTICAGFSRLFQHIMIKLEIPTYYVVGESTVNHAWNMVLLDDGFYNVDLTWSSSDLTRYKYFNKTDSDYKSTHKRTGLSLNLPKCTGTKYRNVINKSNSSINIVKSNSNITSNSNVSSINSNVVAKQETNEEENNINQNDLNEENKIEENKEENNNAYENIERGDLY